MILKDKGLRLMYIIFVLIQWVIASLFQQRERAAYMEYLLSDSLNVNK